MAFPGSPTVNDTHTEGGKNYTYLADGSGGFAWVTQDLAGSGATDLTVTAAPAVVTVESSTGSNADLPLADATNAGLLAPADFSRLSAVPSDAAADQSADEVPVTPGGNLAATDVQAALVELQADIDGVSGLTAENVISGSGAPSAGLGADGDLYENYATGDRYGPKAGGAWGAIIGNVYAQTTLAAATLTTTAAGAAGAATTAARSDHRHSMSIGTTLPSTDGSGGIFHLINGGPLPEGIYSLINGSWRQS